MAALAQIFNSAQQGRLHQRGCLASLQKALKDGVAGPQAFLDCVDVCLPARASAEVEATLDFVSRAVFVKDGAMLAPALKVRWQRQGRRGPRRARARARRKWTNGCFFIPHTPRPSPSRPYPLAPRARST